MFTAAVAIGNTIVHLTPATLAIITGTIVPFVTALITKDVANARVKAICNFAVAAIVGGLASVAQQGGALVLGPFAQAVGTTFAVSILTYFGIWHPAGVTSAISQATANFGIATKTPALPVSQADLDTDLLKRAAQFIVENVKTDQVLSFDPGTGQYNIVPRALADK